MTAMPVAIATMISTLEVVLADAVVLGKDRWSEHESFGRIFWGGNETRIFRYGWIYHGVSGAAFLPESLEEKTSLTAYGKLQ